LRELSAAQIGSEVVVAGWARRRATSATSSHRLRDRSGILQLAFDDRTARDLFQKAQSVRSEFVLMA
jgi:aspartyl-tRNA synthetase